MNEFLICSYNVDIHSNQEFSLKFLNNEWWGWIFLYWRITKAHLHIFSVVLFLSYCDNDTLPLVQVREWEIFSIWETKLTTSLDRFSNFSFFLYTLEAQSYNWLTNEINDVNIEFLKLWCLPPSISRVEWILKNC